MTDEELEALLDELEAGLREDVAAALALTAQEFADGLEGATELVAARFSVSGIRDMWRRRVGGIVGRLRGIARRGADTVADDVGEPLPDGWDGTLDGYTAATQTLLDAVGDRLAAEASQALAEGLNAGEDLDQLKARLAAVFATDGTQLGEGRAQRIAATESARAFNAGTLAAAQALTGPDRPLVKQWLTRNDDRVRPAHRETNGQLRMLDEAFDVDGTPMQYPGDPTAPAALTVACRCILRTATATRPEGTDDVTADGTGEGEEFQSDMPAVLKKYWLTGEGAGKIRWGTPGAFDRCVRNLRDDFPQDPEGLCANLYHEATGRWPGQDKTAAAEVHTGAMIALVPSEADAARLALEGWETPEQLHLTLFYLGEAADWTPEQQAHLISRVATAAQNLTPIAARAFGGAQWNPDSDEPAWVWNVGNERDAEGARLEDAKYEITYALEDGHDDPPLPQQYTPWSPHICAGYGSTNLLDDMAAKTGPVTFDRIRVAFAGVDTDFPLTYEVPPDPDPAVIYDDMDDFVPQVIPWTTPDGAALAFEGQRTGDGRVFAPGSLYRSGAGPWPLHYADRMNGGHAGARLAGAIEGMDLDAGRLVGGGVLYLTMDAGVEAAMLLAQGAPLGVSVDLDDVALEMVAPDDAVYNARLVTASMLPLPDGGFHLTGETETHWTASGAGTVGESARIDIVCGPDGRVPGSAFEITAAAGDSGAGGTVIERQDSGDMLMRIVRARVRGATLVTIPAFADARIVVADTGLFASADTVTAAGTTSDYERVVRHVRKALVPVTAGDAARFLKIPIGDVRRHLGRAAKKGVIVRLAQGRYARVKEGATASATAVAPLANGVAGPGGEGATAVASLDDAVAAELMDLAASGNAFEALTYEEAGETVVEEMEASAWTTMRDMPPMPAAWFAQPTDEELPPGGPGVNYSSGRVFGWVAQAGEPHAGFAKKVTIDGLGHIDTSHFLRQRFTLDDGSLVKAGAFTMNVGHHRDGAECETSACQFDDTRTVAGIVTVGMSSRGMWFSGAAAPWLSEWDRSVFAASQPSYHLKRGNSGNWQLRAVLSVPVPGHSSPLLASAVIDRSNMALTAAATMAEVEEAVAAASAVAPHDVAAVAPEAEGLNYDLLADALVASMARAEDRKAAEAAELATLIAEAGTLVTDIGTVEGGQ